MISSHVRIPDEKQTGPRSAGLRCLLALSSGPGRNRGWLLTDCWMNEMRQLARCAESRRGCTGSRAPTPAAVALRQAHQRKEGSRNYHGPSGLRYRSCEVMEVPGLQSLSRAQHLHPTMKDE
ncbi:hypothetical protein Cadr_000010594 [Camelus dromedarius]|uniref:Uncharacterized protein n=1 Tax=Camelus dromedarius TaxID=9838 RepID=A0A5N4DWG1_CAMDR|nr:hypothetical protein Cadr_000010594 [Camelus dromedarius]